MDYSKNLDLEPIKYFCEFDLIWKVEEWRDIADYEGFYQVSDLGRVKSLKRLVKYSKGNRLIQEKILKQKNKQESYLNSALHKNSVQSNYPTHHIVANVFLGHISCGFKWVINHKNWNKHDNRKSNLEIVTNRQNCSHKKTISSSKYTGVCWNRFRNKWQAQIKVKGKSINLGCHIREIDASKAYQNALKNLPSAL